MLRLTRSLKGRGTRSSTTLRPMSTRRPYFTPDERTLFINVQHPGEVTSEPTQTIPFGDIADYTSWWPAGDKSANRNPATPRPATVAISRPRRWREGANLIPRPEGFDDHGHGDHDGHGKRSRRDLLRRG